MCYHQKKVDDNEIGKRGILQKVAKNDLNLLEESNGRGEIARCLSLPLHSILLSIEKVNKDMSYSNYYICMIEKL